MKYQDYIDGKVRRAQKYGHDPKPSHPMLFDFQDAIARWAIRRGRAAIFADCGLGKTLMQLEWARQSGNRGLIVAPLGVMDQTIAEGRKVGLSVREVGRPDAEPGIQITNYQKLEHFVDQGYDFLVLDESSILKSLDGKTRTLLLTEFTDIPHRLCCTATPSPNDLSELANHAEFLGVMSRVEMLASFFVHDSDRSGSDGWRLKGHAQDAFWRWVAQWAIYIRKPSDIGFEDRGFTLPPLTIEQATVSSNWKPEGMLFCAGLGGIQDRRGARRGTMDERVAKAAEIIQGSDEQWLVWCGLNDEGNALEDVLGDDCVQIAGADDDDAKIEREHAWRENKSQVLITKPSIFGWGMNWQHCHNMLFLGLGDSFEQYYQSIRREWRFGQKNPVRVVIVTSDAEQDIARNVKQKEDDAAMLAENIVAHAKDAMKSEVVGGDKKAATYEPKNEMKLPMFLKGKESCAA